MSIRKFGVLLLCLTAIAHSSSYGQETFSYLLAEKEIEIISATKEAVPYRKVPRNVRIITREELDRWGVRNLFDLLKLLPEFYVRKSNFYLNAVGAFGLRQSYFSEKIQVLIDGIPLTDPSNGSSFSTDNNITLNNVKQVEIIYGPMTSLYGFNAAVVIINLVTYEPEDLKFKAGSSIATSGAKDYHLIKSFNFKKLKGTFFVNYDETQEPLKPFTDWAGRTEKLVRSGKFTNFFLKLKHSSGLYAEIYTVDRDDFFPLSLSNLIVNGDKEFARRKAIIDKVGITGELDGIKLDASLFYNWFYLKRGYNLCPNTVPICSNLSYQNQGFVGLEERYLKSYGTSLYLSKELPFGKLSGGLEVSRADLYKTSLSANFLPSSFSPCNPASVTVFNFQNLPKSETLMPEKQRTNTSYYIQYFWTGERTSVLLNLRADRASDVGTGISYSVSLLYRLNENLNFKLNGGRAIRVPSFEEMYIRNNPVLLGNPDLDLEKVDSIIPSIQLSIGRLKLSGTAYVTWIKDMIYKKPVASNSLQVKWSNADKTVKLKGAILNLNFKVTESVALYTDIHRLFSHSNLNSPGEFFYPDWKAVTGFILNFNRLSLDINTESYSRVSPSVGGYAITNITGNYRFGKRWKAYLQLNNLFDKDIYYSDLRKIPGEGRNLWFGLAYSF